MLQSGRKGMIPKNQNASGADWYKRIRTVDIGSVHARGDSEGEVMTKTKRILVATDLTPASLPAFHEALRIAEENGAELVLTHAYQLPNLGQPVALAGDAYDQMDRQLRRGAESKIEKLLEEARRRNVAARHLVIFGDPYEAIARAAAKEAVDLVIMGTHGRRGVARFFLGSVASRVISTSPCPVLTVRAA
jgi:nucleotide-binding universal stress UspA family protein